MLSRRTGGGYALTVASAMVLALSRRTGGGYALTVASTRILALSTL